MEDAVTDQFDDDKAKKDRSPSYPFISLRKAVERAQALFDGHRKEPTRIGTLALTWNYSPSSSGLQQTVAALKQFGLIDETGAGSDRKVQISDLGRRILADLRPGVREEAILEAARRPKLLSDYYAIWLPQRPSDAHCVSELVFDRGFGEPAAKAFLRVFDETVTFAGLRGADKNADVDTGSDAVEEGFDESGERGRSDPGWKPLVPPPSIRNAGAVPLSERLQVVTTGNQLTISAALVSGREVDKLIRILQANKALLDDDPQPASDQDDE
jgi:hypothetical protein